MLSRPRRGHHVEPCSYTVAIHIHSGRVHHLQDFNLSAAGPGKTSGESAAMAPWALVALPLYTGRRGIHLWATCSTTSTQTFPSLETSNTASNGSNPCLCTSSLCPSFCTMLEDQIASLTIGSDRQSSEVLDGDAHMLKRILTPHKGELTAEVTAVQSCSD